MLSQKLKELRESHGISQASLADKLGVTQQAVGKWERNKTSPDYDALKFIADYFHVTTDYLLGRSASPSPPRAQLTAQEAALLCKYRALSPDHRAAVDAVLDTYAAMDGH